MNSLEVVGPGGQRVTLSGRVASLVWLIVSHAQAINEVPVGKLEADFAKAKLVLRLQQSLGTVQLGTVVGETMTPA